MYSELLLGCGHRREKQLGKNSHLAWTNLTTLDINPLAQPNVVWDLNDRPLPFENDSFDEIHAYEVLEHVGQQGDWKGFFEEFSEYWRILKPGGYLFATVPSIKSPWAWGDPGHTRAIQPETLIFLSQKSYVIGAGKTPLTDYRQIYQADFNLVEGYDDKSHFRFIIQAIKER